MMYKAESGTSKERNDHYDKAYQRPETPEQGILSKNYNSADFSTDDGAAKTGRRADPKSGAG